MSIVRSYRKRLYRAGAFAIAALLGGISLCRSLGLAKCLPNILITGGQLVWWSIFGMPYTQTVESTTRLARYRECWQCPIFNHKRKTCGSHNEPDLGCMCYMPLKTKYKDATCWARDNYLEFGWNE